MAKQNEVMNKLELVENEIDIRGLSQRDYRQLMFRIQIKNNEMLNQIMMNGVEQVIVTRELAKKQGVPDIDKIIDDAFNHKE